MSYLTHTLNRSKKIITLRLTDVVNLHVAIGTLVEAWYLGAPASYKAGVLPSSIPAVFTIRYGQNQPFNDAGHALREAEIWNRDRTYNGIGKIIVSIATHFK